MKTKFSFILLIGMISLMGFSRTADPGINSKINEEVSISSTPDILTVATLSIPTSAEPVIQVIMNYSIGNYLGVMPQDIILYENIQYVTPVPLYKETLNKKSTHSNLPIKYVCRSNC